MPPARSRLLLALLVVAACGDSGASTDGGITGTTDIPSGTTGTGVTDASDPTGAMPTSLTDGPGPDTTAVPTSGDPGSDTEGTGDTTSDTDTGGEPTPESGCAGRLEPVAHVEPIEVVGDGTAASCDEQAVHDAVAALNSAGGGTLTFACGGAHGITLTQSIFFTASAIVDGNGEITLSGGGAVRVIRLDHYLDFVVQRITVRDGHVAPGGDDESGAGLLSPWFGTLKIIDATFENNHSASEAQDVGGGAIYAGGLTEAVLSGARFVGNSGSIGGGVLSRSTNLRVVDSVFVDNSATTYAGDGQYGNGGGLYIDRMWLDAPVDFAMCGGVFTGNHAKQHGSALFSYNLEGAGALIDRSSFTDNDMQDSPGGGTGSVYHQGVPLRLVGSTLAGNSTGAHAGGLFLGGGTDAEITNCTFDGNSTPGNAGALWAGDGVVAVTNTTFSGNSADYGPVIFKGESGVVTLKNTIIAGNTTANEFSALACHATFADAGGNIQWPDHKNNGSPDTPCADGILFADPMLASLADNGGTTPTMAIAAGSPAVDVARECPQYDQRGMPRAGACDAGAYEYQP